MNNTVYQTLVHETLHLMIPGGHVDVAKAIGINILDVGLLSAEGLDAFARGKIDDWLTGCLEGR